MTYLIASLIGLAIGPLLFFALHRRQAPQLFLDGFVLVAVVGLVVLHVLPEALGALGPLALLVATVGLLLPLLAEKVRALSHQASHGVVLSLALVGLLLHAALDGAGLNGSEGLGLAVVLHRVPVGLAVWWFVRPQFGRPWAIAVLAALSGATVAGFMAQSTWIAPSGAAWVQAVQALVAGSLLHVLLHQSVGFHNHAPSSGWRMPGMLGAVAGAAVVALTPDAHGHGLGEAVLSSAAHLAPYLLGALALALLVWRRMPWRVLDVATPWAVTAVLLSALLVHAHDTLGAVELVWVVALAAVVVLSLAHQGPRDFVLKVLPLDLLAERHDHDAHHEHDHAEAHG